MITSPSCKSGRVRLHYLDNLRTFLTALVILHHTAGAYGGIVFNAPIASATLSMPLIIFNVINQTFFMGMFFFMSGYFSATVLREKGNSHFVKEKVVRLGIPTLIYSLSVPPLEYVTIEALSGREKVLVGRAFARHWQHLRGVRGPVWYCALLLGFDLIFAATDHYQPALLQSVSRVRNPLLPLGMVIGSNVVIRLYYPVGQIFIPLNIQPANLPQYILLYVWGANSNLRTLSTSVPCATLRKLVALNGALIGTLALVVHKYGADMDAFLGGTDPRALLYCILNETLGLLIGISIFEIFRKDFDQKWVALAQYSYAAFLVHAPVSAAIEAKVRQWHANAVTKTIVVGLLNIIASWIVGWCLAHIPGVKRVLM